MSSFLRLFVVGSGGFVGAVLRYLVSGWAQDWSGSVQFPFGTMAVNMIGCFFIGFLSFLVESRGFFSVDVRSFLLIGLLGAFTTFSTFGNETLALVRNGRVDLAAINATSQVLVGLVMVWMGRITASGIWR